jgi:hypothetical protein
MKPSLHWKAQELSFWQMAVPLAICGQVLVSQVSTQVWLDWKKPLLHAQAQDLSCRQYEVALPGAGQFWEG